MKLTGSARFGLLVARVPLTRVEPVIVKEPEGAVVSMMSSRGATPSRETFPAASRIEAETAYAPSASACPV